MKYDINTNGEIEERFWQIPEDLQETILDQKSKIFVDKVALRYGIDTSLVWVLNHLVFNILLAIEPIKGFSQRIAQQAHTAPAMAQKIAEEINENIFRPVRQSLIKIHGIPPNEQAEIPAVEAHFEHLLENHAPGMIALTKSTSPSTPKTLAEQKMSRPTSLPPQISRTDSQPDPYREPIA